MQNFRILFKLKHPDEIAPFGMAPNLSLHWFGLMDGLLWIQVGEQTIYEYSEASEKYFGCFMRYNDYQLSRFMEDFFETFKYVGESIPRELHDDLEHFDAQVQVWKERRDAGLTEGSPEEDEWFDKLYFEEYCEPMEWYWRRSFDSGHLVGGPYIGCFRCDDRIKIMWESDFFTDEGQSIWTSPKGCLEISYDEFVDSVTAFFQVFCDAMDEQVAKALRKEWGEIRLDKKFLAVQGRDTTIFGSFVRRRRNK